MVKKTYSDLFREVNERYGIQTTTQFHVDPSKELSDKEYQEHLKTYKAVGEFLDGLGRFGRKEEK